MEEVQELLDQRAVLDKEERKLKKRLKEIRSESETLDLKILPFFQDGEMRSSPSGSVYRKESKLIYVGRDGYHVEEDPATQGGL